MNISKIFRYKDHTGVLGCLRAYSLLEINDGAYIKHINIAYTEMESVSEMGHLCVSKPAIVGKLKQIVESLTAEKYCQALADAMELYFKLELELKRTPSEIA